jgi:sirohydrochlorin ferrochelatase
MDRIESPELPHWASFADRSEIAFHEARGLSNLGNHRAAVELCKKGVEETRAAPRNNVSTRAFIAATLATGGDTAAAVSESLTVLDTLEESPISSGRIMRRLGIVRDASTSVDATDEFRQRLDRLASCPTTIDSS